MKTIGRLLARKEKVAGLFIPFGKDGLKNGIWEIREVLGEYVLVYLGPPAMPDVQYQSFAVSELLGQPSAAMTEEEMNRLT